MCRLLPRDLCFQLLNEKFNMDFELWQIGLFLVQVNAWPHSYLLGDLDNSIHTFHHCLF